MNWKLHRRHYPRSLLPYGVVLSVIAALTIVILAGFVSGAGAVKK